MKKLRHFISNQHGYTLVVVAALFAAFAVTISAYLDRNVVTQQLDRQAQVRAQMSRIMTAIALYKYDHAGRYPCPAAANVIPTHSNFGVVFTKTTTGCDTKPTDPMGDVTSAALVTLTSSSSELIRGMVPVRTLANYGLDINDAFDPWGSRIMYVINRNLTLSATATATVYPTLTNTTINYTMLPPDYLLVSYGRDRRGGYLRSQSASSLNSGATIACTGTELRSENCNTDNVFKIAASYTPTNAATTTYFDDIVMPKIDAPLAGESGGAGCGPTQCEVIGWVYNGPCGACADNGEQWESIGTGCRKYQCNSGTIADIGAPGACHDTAMCM